MRACVCLLEGVRGGVRCVQGRATCRWGARLRGRHNNPPTHPPTRARPPTHPPARPPTHRRVGRLQGLEGAEARPPPRREEHAGV